MNKVKKKIRPERFYFLKDRPDVKRVVKAQLGLYLNTLPIDRYFKIVVSEAKEKRSDEQNGLWWAWNHELVRAHDDSEDKDYYHAVNKLEVLLPLMCHEWDRWREEGEFIRSMIVVQQSHKAMLAIAYRCIESSDLNAEEGVMYTDRLQKHWEERGVKLVIKPSMKKYSQHPEAQA